MESILSTAFLQKALEESGHGIIVADPDGTILSASEKMVELTGYSVKELVGSTPRIFRSGHTTGETYRKLWETIRSGQTWTDAILNRRKDGTFFLDRETILGAIGPNGGRTCFVALHRNADVELELRLKVMKAESRFTDAVEKIDEAKDKVQKLVSLTNERLMGTAGALTATLEARDPYTAGHGRRTAQLMDLIGGELGLFDKYSRSTLCLGATLHDIGKVGIPDAILQKPGKLTPAEYEVIKTHPGIGFDILNYVLKQEEILRIVRHHHERLDGSGYPDGLTSDQLPDYVRAFSVCDCYVAMTSTRSYRLAMSSRDAVMILTDDALSGKLDMPSVKALRRLWKNGVLEELRHHRAA